MSASTAIRESELCAYRRTLNDATLHGCREIVSADLIEHLEGVTYTGNRCPDAGVFLVGIKYRDLTGGGLHAATLAVDEVDWNRARVW